MPNIFKVVHSERYYSIVQCSMGSKLCTFVVFITPWAFIICTCIVSKLFIWKAVHCCTTLTVSKPSKIFEKCPATEPFVYPNYFDWHSNVCLFSWMRKVILVLVYGNNTITKTMCFEKFLNGTRIEMKTISVSDEKPKERQMKGKDNRKTHQFVRMSWIHGF